MSGRTLPEMAERLRLVKSAVLGDMPCGSLKILNCSTSVSSSTGRNGSKGG
jgi:hypothetical protein